MESNTFVEFSTKIASEYGIEIAIMLGFFRKCYSLTQGGEPPSYPSVPQCCRFFNFWDEDKIRGLIAQLITLKLI